MTDDLAVSSEMSSLARCKRLYDQAAGLARIGAFECDLATEALTWTDGVYDLFGFARGSTLSRAATVDLYHEASRREMERLRAKAIREGGRFTLDARIRTVGGADRWMRLSADVVYENGRATRLFGAKQDISHEKELWDRLRQLAERDALTGLTNRGVFEARLDDLAKHDLAKHDDGGGAMSALALVDLDHFKQINDRFGHSAGDECLRQVAARLSGSFEDAILVARIGGDEFAVLMRAPLGRPEIARRLDRALHMLCRPVIWKGERIDLGVSIGVTILDRPGRSDPARLFAEADSALYVAKGAGRKTVRTFGEHVGDRLHPAAPDRSAGRPLLYG